MTKRTSLPLSSEGLAARFVDRADVIISRCAARHDVNRRTARLRLLQVVGGGWIVSAETHVSERLDSGQDTELAAAARALAMATVAELSVADRGRLLAQMHSGDSELSGTVPGHFIVRLVEEAAAGFWALKVTAHANGSGVTVAAVEGQLTASAQARQTA